MNGKERLTFKLLLIALTIFWTGCSGANNVELGEVTGTVSMDGKPLADVIVVFEPAEGNPSSGRTDENGKYELTYLENSKGAIIGSSKVHITTAPDSNLENDGEIDLAGVDLATTTEIDLPPVADGDVTKRQTKDPTNPKFKKDPIPAKYNSKTTLTANVKAGENTFDFKLDSK